jgi:hypothetical protein
MIFSRKDVSRLAGPQVATVTNRPQALSEEGELGSLIPSSADGETQKKSAGPGETPAPAIGSCAAASGY